MTHKCPTEPCEDCWNEARTVGSIVVALGLIVAFLWGVGWK